MSVRALREKLGDEEMAGLHEVVADAGERWKDDVLAVTGERFERRLAEQMATLRVEIGKEFAALRIEMAKEFANVREEMAQKHADLLKWAFLFWIGQLAAMSAMMALLLRTVGPR